MTEVIVYSTNFCPWCVKAKDFLKQNGIKYIEKNVEENDKFAEELFAKSGGGAVPVLDINGTIIVGFSVPKIKAALGMK